MGFKSFVFFGLQFGKHLTGTRSSRCPTGGFTLEGQIWEDSLYECPTLGCTPIGWSTLGLI